jgi:5-methylcytosine-specific restriction endonuclease McrBC GTP-binding regulatory subunit McrB
MEKIRYNTGIKKETPRNKILFGAPGTGKSFNLNKERNQLMENNNELDYERVTFHPDYSYANFVGTYKPVMISTKHEVELEEDKKEIIAVLQDENKTAQEKYDLLYEKFKDDGLTRLPILLGLYTDENFKTKKQDGTDAVGDNSVERNHGKAIRPYVELLSTTTTENEIAYKYVPGPFMRILAKALKSAMTESPKPYLLLIEEINRANVAAVFGDANGVSEYEIATTNDMRLYLAEELDVDESAVETIKIPDNMFIWATMNSADQGVFPMDTAFKRRWDFTYLGIDDAESEMSDEIKKKEFTFGQGDYARVLTWNEIRRAINDELSSESYNINEDKLLGPYFISKSILEGDADSFMKVFKNKVLMYLFDDAVKQKKNTFFENCKDNKKGVRYSELCDAFDEMGVFIFPEGVSSRFTKKLNPKEEGAE